MCGIAGAPDADTARAMIAALAHRGPDGMRASTGGAYALAHARLAIIDLAGGWQPLKGPNARVVGNGEIYNYLELTQDHQLGEALKTGSDFEPLLHLYAKEQDAAFKRLRGMYALGLEDQAGALRLKRDPFGIKPLYLADGPNGVVFASEPRAFFAAGVATPRLNVGKARELLALNYTLGEDTIYEGVRRLAPGEMVAIEGGGARFLGREETRIDGPPQPRSEEEAVAALDRVLEDSVRVHQRSDVPFGLFLSGGVDSTAIAVLMARLNERAVTAYTCGFDAPGARDERAHAERVARALDLDWREILFDEETFWRVLPGVVWALDDPTSDYACLPTFALADAAKQTLKVVLSGEGGDEMFGGYGRYRRAMRPAWLGGRPAAPREPALKAAFDAAIGPVAGTRLQQAQAADIATWLPNDLLLKLDRMLMAHGLEGRTPFLDREVLAFASGLPDKLKVRGRLGKWIVRQWLARVCPAAQPFARKRGFTVPVEAWIAPHAAAMAPRIAQAEGLGRLGLADHARAVFADPAADGRRWPYMFFALWHAVHIEGAAPADAVAALHA